MSSGPIFTKTAILGVKILLRTKQNKIKINPF
jgi:hypothetical protein